MTFTTLQSLKRHQLELDDASFSPIQTVESQMALLAESAQAKQLAFYSCIMSDVPQEVRGDNRRFGQVLYHLLANAIDKTDFGTVAISVSGKLESNDRVRLCFDIYDTAMRTDADAVPDDTGVGLTISKQLVQLMQGNIGMHNLPGGGTQWQLDVILSHDPAYEASDLFLPLHQLPVLYVDSSALNRKLLCNQFASWGMKPTALHDQDAAIAALNAGIWDQRPFPLVRDPPRSACVGWLCLCRDIRNDETIAATKTLLLTGRDEGPIPVASGLLPFDSSLSFPIHAIALGHALLELIEQPRNPASKGGATSPLPTAQVPSSAGLRILLVEDNRVNQQVALTMLKKWGHQIDVAWNGLEALEAIQRQAYDLVLMDIQMPEMDGLTATQQIRLLDGTCASVPIVAVTANAMQGDRERFFGLLVLMTTSQNRLIATRFTRSCIATSPRSGHPSASSQRRSPNPIPLHLYSATKCSVISSMSYPGKRFRS